VKLIIVILVYGTGSPINDFNIAYILLAVCVWVRVCVPVAF